MTSKFVLKVGRKGVVVLPKDLREAANLNEGDRLIAELQGGRIILRPFKPVRVKIDPKTVEDLIREELELEEEKERSILEALSRTFGSGQ